MNILVTGANGQLGNEMRVLSTQYPQHTYFFTDIAELDITSREAVSQFVADNAIDIIVNCAAYTNVDKAEIERCVKYMTDTTGGTFVMHEAFNANDPTDYSRDYFTWPCSLYAHLVLTEILGVNLLGN